MFTYKLTVSRICLYVGIRTYVKFTHARVTSSTYLQFTRICVNTKKILIQWPKPGSVHSPSPSTLGLNMQWELQQETCCKFIAESNSEIILKIAQHFRNLCLRLEWCSFSEPFYNLLHFIITALYALFIMSVSCSVVISMLSNGCSVSYVCKWIIRC